MKGHVVETTHRLVSRPRLIRIVLVQRRGSLEPGGTFEVGTVAVHHLHLSLVDVLKEVAAERGPRAQFVGAFLIARHEECEGHV